MGRIASSQEVTNLSSGMEKYRKIVKPELHYVQLTNEYICGRRRSR